MNHEGTRVRPWSMTGYSDHGESYCTIKDENGIVADRVPDVAAAERIIKLPQLEAAVRQADQLLTLLFESASKEQMDEAAGKLEALIFRVGMRTYTPEVQTCPRRMLDVGPWEYKEGLDRWEFVGVDRVCNFCGSIHPEDFEAFLDRVAIDEGCRVEPSTKGYKFYLRAPEIPNAGAGAIKFYTHHLPKDQEFIDRLNKKYAVALRESQRRFDALMAAIREARNQ